MIVFVGEKPNRNWLWSHPLSYYETYPSAWLVDYLTMAGKEALMVEINKRIMKPHNSRSYSYIKREDLEDILKEAQYTLFFRNLFWKGIIPCSREDLEHAIQRIPELLKSPNQRFKVLL